MTPPVIGLIVFAVVLLLLAISAWPATRKLDGRQKYRRDRRAGSDLDPEANKRASMSPLQIALAMLMGRGASTEASDADGGDVGNFSDDGGGGDGGGD